MQTTIGTPSSWSRLSVLAGVEAPTGDEAERPGPGLAPPSLLQLGSGTWDPLLGYRIRSEPGTVTFDHSLVAKVPLGESDGGVRTVAVHEVRRV